MRNNIVFTSQNNIDSRELPLAHDVNVRRYTSDEGIDDIFLPRRVPEAGKVIVQADANRYSYLNLPSSGSLPFRMKIKAGSKYIIEYHKNIDQWVISGEDINYLTSKSGNEIPENPPGITCYSIDNSHYISEVILPPTAEEGSIIFIRSSANRETKISGENRLHPNIETIRGGEQYVFRYQSYGEVWFVEPASFQVYDKSNIQGDYSKSNFYTPPINTYDSGLEIAVASKIMTRVSQYMTYRENINQKSVSEPENDHLTFKNNSEEYVLSSDSSNIELKLSDGHWVRNIRLPQQAVDKNKVIIKSDAQYNSYLHLPFTKIEIKSGSKYLLEYNENIEQWNISGEGVKILTPETNGDIIPADYGRITYYLIKDNDWISTVRLPDIAEDGAFIIVQSTATNDSEISTENLLFASTTTLKTNDQYIFKYVPQFNKWVIESAPDRGVDINSDGEMARLTTPIAGIMMTDRHRWANVNLPRLANDRDKIIFTSSTDAITLIDIANVNNPAKMELRKGEQYTFFYISEKNGWQLMSAPDTVYQAQDIANGEVPLLYTPRTIINVTKNESVSTLRLPGDQVPGTRIIINNGTDNEISLWAGNIKHNALKRELVTFKVDEQQIWQRETVTIDLLLLYSDKAADESGEEIIRELLMENFNKTNEALENSGANFRYRIVGIEKIKAKDNWTDLRAPLSELRDDRDVQKLRDDLKADGIYYMGNDGGYASGWGYIGGGDRGDNMIAVGASNSGPNIMRHELGHNMGLQHGGESSNYNQGYPLLATIMAGQDISYYSTPDRYTADYGRAMGIPNKFDAVRWMNENSAAVAAYR